jgi:hypothetical protein
MNFTKFWIYVIVATVLPISGFVFCCVKIGFWNTCWYWFLGSIAIGIVYYAFLAIIGDGDTILKRIASGMMKYTAWGFNVFLK